MIDKTISVGAVSLGCDKNRVDTENMLSYVEKGGYVITPDESKADVIIINTCAFIESSQREAIDTILEFVEMKKQRDLKIIVTGCLPERYKSDVVKNFPEVDAFLGIAEYSRIAEVIREVTGNKGVVDFTPCDMPTVNRVLTTPYHYAYLKIADGCDNHCTYCAIPSIRGKFRSRTVESLVEEAKGLVDNYGVKEINLVAQDITRYGIDIYGEYALPRLINELTKLDIEWIRLLYCYPELLSDDLIKIIAENPKVCKYVDIPLQHINDRVLKLMGRHVTKDDVVKLIEKIRSADSDIAIRSTFIVGFPTETEEEFNELYDFIKDYKLNYAGFFAYSKEEGTAAAKLSGQIPARIKQSRLKKITSLQTTVIAENNQKYLGKNIRVLCEGVDFDRQLFYGRPEFCAPDVDAKVYFKSGSNFDAGKFKNVVITDVEDYDLLGDVK